MLSSTLLHVWQRHRKVQKTYMNVTTQINPMPSSTRLPWCGSDVTVLAFHLGWFVSAYDNIHDGYFTNTRKITFKRPADRYAQQNCCLVPPLIF